MKLRRRQRICGYQDDVVQVTGVLHSQHLRDHLLEVVQAVPGVSKVRSEVSLIILGSIEL
jgi:hypothetical protein